MQLNTKGVYRIHVQGEFWQVLLEIAVRLALKQYRRFGLFADAVLVMLTELNQTLGQT